MPDNPAATDEVTTPDPATATPDITVDAGEKGTDTGAQTTKVWSDGLDPDLKSNPSITKFKDVNELAKSYVEIQKVVGKEKIVVPTDKSTPQEWDAFWKKVGRPDKDAEYEVPTLDMPEEVKMRQENLDAFKKRAHGLGLTKKQFVDLYGLYNELTLQGFNQELEQINGLKAEAETSLRQEWGQAYDVKVSNAQKLVNKFFKDKGIRKEFSVLANDKGFIKGMAEIAEQFSEDVLAGQPRDTKTPGEAAKELSSILSRNHDLSKAYFDSLHPEHKYAVDRVVELQHMASAGGA